MTEEATEATDRGSVDAADRSQVRGSSLLLVGRVVAAALNLGVQVLIVRALSRAGYGAFAYALAIAGVGEVVSMFGMRHALTRYLPIYEERGEHGKVLGTTLLATATLVVVGVVFVLAVWVGRDLVAGQFAGDATALRLLIILALLAPLMGAENLLDALYATFSKPMAIFVRQYVLVPALRLVAVLVVVIGPSDPVVLAVGYVLSGALGVAIAIGLLVRLLRERGTWAQWRSAAAQVPLREILVFTVPLFADDLTALLIEAADALLLGQLGTPEQVAALRAVLPIARANQYVELSFGLLFTPLAARRFARDDVAGLGRSYWHTAMWSAVLAFPILAVSTVLARPVTVLLFGDRYADAAPVLALLAAGYYVSAVTGPNRSLLAVYGKVKEIVTLNAFAVAANIGLNVALIPRLGAVGAAIGTLATFTVRNVLIQVVIGRTTGVAAIDRSAIPVYLLVGACAVIVGVTTVVDPTMWIGVPVVAATSLAVLVFARGRLELGATFPAIARVPVLRWLDAGGRR